MATLAEIQADRKAKQKAKKEATDKKTKAAREKFIKRNKDFLKSQSEKRYKRETRADKRARLKADLKAEESLAQSRTFRGQGKDVVADLHLKNAERAKKRAKSADDRLARRERVKKLKEEGKTANEIFRDRLDKKPIVKKPVVKPVDKKVIKKTKPTDPNRGNKVPGIHSSEYLTTTPRPDFDKTKVKKAGRNKALTDKLQKTVIDRAKKDNSSTLKKLFGASEEKREMGRRQMDRARASMGMKHGGNVKQLPERTSQQKAIAAAKRKLRLQGKTPAPLPSSRPVGKAMERTRKPNMKHGGVVKRTKMGKVRTANPRNIDGIAKRGLTRAKHR